MTHIHGEMKKAIVTIVIGNKFENIFAELCRTNWQNYCTKFGYDLIVLTETLDNSERAQKRSIAWQKLLILSQKWSSNYSRIVWVDADILMNNSNAKDICDEVPIEKIGAVEAYSIPSKELHTLSLERLYKSWQSKNISYLDNINPGMYYTNRNISGEDLTEVVQTGVFVCSPKHHKEIFEHIYFNYEDNHGSEWNYEMPAMSYELIKANLLHWISPRFNIVVAKCQTIFYPKYTPIKKGFIAKVINKITRNESDFLNHFELYQLKNIYDISFFMHFAGNNEKMNLMKTILNDDPIK